jgi:hypothetical protein
VALDRARCRDEPVLKPTFRGLNRLGSRLELVSNALDLRPHERHGDVSYFRIQLLGGVARVSRVGQAAYSWCWMKSLTRLYRAAVLSLGPA